jgi:glutamate carboxypeptidase
LNWHRIREAAGSVRGESLLLLNSLVDVNSYSANAEGVNRVGDMVIESLPALLDRRFFTDGSGVRHHVISNPAAGKSLILMIGHLDTVYPMGTRHRSFERVGGRILGPGTADMKGGVVVMIQALRVLDELGYLDEIPVKCLFNGDEETGSAFSSKLLAELVQGVSFGLVFESGGLGGEIVTQRRGVARYELSVSGQAGHAGHVDGPKASAVAELAHKILALEDLNDRETGIAVNVGTVGGGTATNVVPDHASANFEIRFWDKESGEKVDKRLREIIGRPEIPGCELSLKEIHRSPCMVPAGETENLVKIVQAAAAELGQKVQTEKRGGASDGNFLSEMGIPVVDGLGPVGDLDHSPDEYIVEQSLYDRIDLTALLLCRLAGIE